MINRSADSMRVCVLEERIASFVNLLHICEVLGVVADGVTNDSGALKDSTLIEAEGHKA